MAARSRVQALPLSGRRVLITRAAAQASSFARLLREAGAEVIEAPTIAIEPPESWDRLDDAVARLSDFGWVVFTSVNGVMMFGTRLLAHGLGWETLAQARVAAIGPATSAALRSHAIRVEVVPGEYTAEGLVERLRPLIEPGDKVLLPRAAETRDVLVRELRALGAAVVEVPAYRIRAALDGARRARAALERNEIDVVTFTSSSTVRNFAALFTDEERRRLLPRVAVAAIGPITAAAAAALGLRTSIVPGEYTIPALARAIVEYFSSARAGSGAGERS